MPIPFYIRYLLLCKKTSVTFRHLIGPYSIVFIYSIALLISLLFCYPPIPEVYEPYKAALNNSFWLDEYPGGPVFAAKPPASF
uniref:Oligopeptide transport permease C-like N-terminal domain-containing protein n=1 Tax=Panagrolaimus davidi TaxID=227884 RepID=A0A914QWL2_9BILA